MSQSSYIQKEMDNFFILDQQPENLEEESHPLILIVDDSYFNCYALELLLDTFNLKSEYVMDGSECEI